MQDAHDGVCVCPVVMGVHRPFLGVRAVSMHVHSDRTGTNGVGHTMQAFRAPRLTGGAHTRVRLSHGTLGTRNRAVRSYIHRDGLF